MSRILASLRQHFVKLWRFLARTADFHFRNIASGLNRELGEIDLELCDRCSTRFGKWVDRQIRWWVFGKGFACTKDGESGYREAIQLMELLLVEVLALLGYVFATGIDKTLLVTLVYVVASAVPVLGLFLLLCAKHRDRPYRRAFNRGTIMFTRWMFGVGIVVVTIVAIACWNEKLPGQGAVKPVRLKAHKVQLYSWRMDSKDEVVKAGDEGVSVLYRISRSVFAGDDYPQPLHLKVEVLPLLGEDWEIRAVRGVTLKGEDVEVGPEIFPTSENIHYTVIWNRMDDALDYELELLFHARTKKNASAEKLLSAIQNLEDAVIVSATGPR
jgi:heme/copper-type cytochrome/quinol oxidase subunit 2